MFKGLLKYFSKFAVMYCSSTQVRLESIFLELGLGLRLEPSVLRLTAVIGSERLILLSRKPVTSQDYMFKQYQFSGRLVSIFLNGYLFTVYSLFIQLGTVGKVNGAVKAT